jgi:uncharacterized protein (TIGR00251 family)
MGDCTTIVVRVIPNAAQTRCEGRDEEGVFKIRLQARPEKGKANKALILFLAKRLGVGRSAIALLSGDKARQKRLAIEGLTEASVARRLLASD